MAAVCHECEMPLISRYRCALSLFHDSNTEITEPFLGDLPHGLPGEIGLVLDAVAALGIIDNVERLEVYTPRRQAEGCEEPAVGVVSAPGTMLGQRLGDVVIHSYEDNGREHSGHRENGAAAHRQNQRFGRVTEMLADTSLFCDVVFKGLEVARDLCLEPGQITAMETGPRDAD